MDSELSSVFKITSSAPTDGIVSCVPNFEVDSAKCESILQMGFFFDGTDNNMFRDDLVFGDSNVVRLWKTYEENKSNGVHRFYIPGVGTPFPEIGEKDTSTFGNAFGSGCYSRILYALLRLFNEVAIHLENKPIFNNMQIRNIISAELSSDSAHAERCSFLSDRIAQITKIHREGRVKVREFYVDIFGFSRGAAEARVFSTWLVDLLQCGRFAGIPFTVRFLGIFDTVASAGVVGSIGNAIVNSTGGHTGWADAKFLRVRSEVKNCIHMVAMHEIRKNFPLDEVSVAGTIPANCQEFAYPGAHSDIGGGYRPGQLGLANGESMESGDTRKLSQVPLRHMLACAIAAGAPMAWAEDARLEIHPDVEIAYRSFLATGAGRLQKLSEWMLPYLAWRLQVGKQYEMLPHVRRANDEDRKLLIGGNSTLMNDAIYIDFKGDSEKASEFVKLARKIKGFDLKRAEYRQDEISALDPEAPDVFAQAKTYLRIPDEVAHFFDTYVHDSLAGFRKDLKEPTGYWRFRRSFRGSNVPELAKKDAPNQTQCVA